MKKGIRSISASSRKHMKDNELHSLFEGKSGYHFRMGDRNPWLFISFDSVQQYVKDYEVAFIHKPRIIVT